MSNKIPDDSNKNMAKELKRNIGLWSAITIVIGSVIGSGIFMKPATMAAQLGSPVLLTVVWLVAGVISIFGGMIYAELGAMMPETGGQYIYTRAVYGEFTAFLYGWSTVAVINTAAVASIAFVCANYAGYFIHLPRFPPGTEHSIRLHIPFVADIFPLENFGVKMMTIAIIGVLTLVNYLSTRFGNGIQFIATVLKVAALAVIIGGILFSGKGEVRNLIDEAPGFHLKGWALMAAFMAAVTGAFASYDGWSNVNLVAGEIRDPVKNLSKSLIIGLIACILIYVLINLAFLYVLPVEKMAGSSMVATDAIGRVMGVGGAGIIAGLIVVSAFGATNINLLTNARVVFAMGESRDFFSWAGRVHPKFGTPGNSVIVMGVWSSLFVLSGSFDILADMYIFMSWIFYGLTAVDVFVLRRKMPDAKRPYKVPGYPVIPLIFVLFTLFYVGATLYNDIADYAAGRSPMVKSVVGIALTLIGAPLYWYFRRQKR